MTLSYESPCFRSAPRRLVRALAPAAFGWRDQRRDMRPFGVGEIAGTAQLVAVVFRSVLGGPHRRPLQNQATDRESYLIHPIQLFSDGHLVLLRHKRSGGGFWRRIVWQHGHRVSLLARATMRYRLIVAIEFVTCRSGRTGGVAGSIIFG